MVDTLNSAIASDIRNSYLRYLEKFSKEEQRSIAVNHFGVFSQDLVNSIANGVEEIMVSSGDQKKLIKRVFSILIEGLQNIRSHGEKDELNRQLAFLFLCKNAASYKIVFGNIIQNEDRVILVEYLERINGLGLQELKDLYMNVLTNGFLSKKGGAGLGFLTMRIKSENVLKYSIENLDGKKSLFTVEILLNRH
ncbi:MAG: hypothetical protein RI883_1130 [Bacteroidota bacterium]|jgi:hypothetical protein